MTRLLVLRPSGDVLLTEYHESAAVAEERAIAYERDGYTCDTTDGELADDGTFTPSNVGG